MMTWQVWRRDGDKRDFLCAFEDRHDAVTMKRLFAGAVAFLRPEWVYYVVPAMVDEAAS